MSDVVIRVEGLSKRFKVGRAKQGYRTFREQITSVALKPVRALKGIGAGARTGSRGDDTIWALKDVSFEVKQGEALGIIGRNGAGKSTLLKVLSRITEPTEGQIEIRGRVGSLLEVGTGFHPELTGRENIFLNGAILGMNRALIRRKFDEIVSFAEVERFIDTPVKHYSSGMYLRLAFAVAAHLEPEVLLVDEVLAVGDVAFQKKCLGKMSEVAGQGRTVLFVTHDMGAVARITSSCVYLNQGRLLQTGPTDQVIAHYLDDAGLHTLDGYAGDDRGPIRLTDCRLLLDGRPAKAVPFGERLELAATWRANEEVHDVSFFASIESSDGRIIGTASSRDDDLAVDMPAGSERIVTWTTDAAWPFLPGIYRVSVFVDDLLGRPLAGYERAAAVEIANINAPPRYRRQRASDGVVFLPGRWRTMPGGCQE